MGRYCYICSFHIKSKDPVKRTLHQFPRDEKLRKEWVKFSKLSDRDDFRSVRICSGHFTSDDYMQPNAKLFGGKLQLKAGAVPSIYSPLLISKIDIEECEPSSSSISSDVKIEPLSDESENESRLTDLIKPHLLDHEYALTCPEKPNEPERGTNGGNVMVTLLNGDNVMVTPINKDNVMVTPINKDNVVVTRIDGDHLTVAPITGNNLIVTPINTDNITVTTPLKRDNVLVTPITANNLIVTPINRGSVTLTPINGDNVPINNDNVMLTSVIQHNEMVTPTTEDDEKVTPINEDDDMVTPINENDELPTPVSGNNSVLKPKTRKFANARFISEIEPTDFATPREAVRVIKFIKEADSEKSRKIKNLVERRRYLLKKINSMKNLVKKLHGMGLMDDEAQKALMKKLKSNDLGKGSKNA